MRLYVYMNEWQIIFIVLSNYIDFNILPFLPLDMRHECWMAVGNALVHLPFDLQGKDTQCSWVVGVVRGGSTEEHLMQ